MVNKKLTKSQPHVFCDTPLYKEYRRLIKDKHRDLTVHNTLIFEKAVKEEIEALKTHKIDSKEDKTFSELARNN
jgi:hypothetical protein